MALQWNVARNCFQLTHPFDVLVMDRLDRIELAGEQHLVEMVDQLFPCG